MKTQTDMIVSIVAVLLALIMAGVFFGTARQPIKPNAPEAVTLGPLQYPTGGVTYANNLPGGSGGGPGGAGGPGAPADASKIGGMPGMAGR